MCVDITKRGIFPDQENCMLLEAAIRAPFMLPCCAGVFSHHSRHLAILKSYLRVSGKDTEIQINSILFNSDNPSKRDTTTNTELRKTNPSIISHEEAPGANCNYRHGLSTPWNGHQSGRVLGCFVPGPDYMVKDPQGPVQSGSIFRS